MRKQLENGVTILLRSQKWWPRAISAFRQTPKNENEFDPLFRGLTHEWMEKEQQGKPGATSLYFSIQRLIPKTDIPP